MEFPEKLLELRQSLGLTQEEFAARLGITSNYVSLLEKGKKQPSDAILRHVELIERLHRTGMNESRKSFFGSDEGGATTPRDEPAGADVRSYRFANKSHPQGIPVLGWAHAGQTTGYEELPQSWQRRIPTDCRDPKAFGVTLEGDSMEPMFRDGDLLVLMPSQPIHNGCMAVVRLASDGVLLRRIEIRGERLKLVPMNPRYEVDEVGMDEVSWVYPVWGRWTQFWK
jgi:SOS-response transcriptional repressor LexA